MKQCFQGYSASFFFFINNTNYTMHFQDLMMNKVKKTKDKTFLFVKDFRSTAEDIQNTKVAL